MLYHFTIMRGLNILQFKLSEVVFFFLRIREKLFKLNVVFVVVLVLENRPI